MQQQAGTQLGVAESTEGQHIKGNRSLTPGVGILMATETHKDVAPFQIGDAVKLKDVNKKFCIDDNKIVTCLELNNQIVAKVGYIPTPVLGGSKQETQIWVIGLKDFPKVVFIAEHFTRA